MGIVLPTSEMRSANPKRAIQDLARAMFYISRKLRGEVPKPEILEKLIQQN
jgi:hypothetical protein